jgi:hypothetical protein
LFRLLACSLLRALPNALARQEIAVHSRDPLHQRV